MDLILVESKLNICIQPPVLNLMVIKLDTYLIGGMETQQLQNIIPRERLLAHLISGMNKERLTYE